MVRKDREGNKFLVIFDSFEVDTKLPKHKKEKQTSGVFLAEGGNTSIGSWNNSWATPTEDDYNRSFMEKLAFGNGFWNGVMYWLCSKVGIFKLLKEDKKTPKLNAETIKTFFESIKAAKKELNLHDSELLKRYEETITDAQIAGQTALVESLGDKVGIILMESKLVEEKFPIYIMDDDIIKFYEETDETKKLKLVWIKNFVRIIPTEIIDIKKKVDSFKVFDNYVILTFDPLDQMEKMTKKEVDKAKDPILFGVIKGSNKLYFIADWEDEYCNLRLENVLEKLGKDPDLLNNQSITIYSQKQSK